MMDANEISSSRVGKKFEVLSNSKVVSFTVTTGLIFDSKPTVCG